MVEKNLGIPVSLLKRAVTTGATDMEVPPGVPGSLSLWRCSSVRPQNSMLRSLPVRGAEQVDAPDWPGTGEQMAVVTASGRSEV